MYSPEMKRFVLQQEVFIRRVEKAGFCPSLQSCIPSNETTPLDSLSWEIFSIITVRVLVS